MNNPEQEVQTTEISTSDVADLRKALRNLIAIGKKIAPALSANQRAELVDVMFKAELRLK